VQQTYRINVVAPLNDASEDALVDVRTLVRSNRERPGDEDALLGRRLDVVGAVELDLKGKGRSAMSWVRSGR